MAVDDRHDRNRPRWKPLTIYADDRPGLNQIQEDMARLAEFLEVPLVDNIQFVVLNKVPLKPRQAMIAYFQGGVVGPQPGFYEYTGTAWAKL